MPEIQRPEVIDALQGLLGGRVRLAELESLIKPVVVAANASRLPYDKAGYWGAAYECAAVAGELSMVGINNPETSGIDLTIDYAGMTNQSGTGIRAFLRVDQQVSTEDAGVLVHTTKLLKGRLQEDEGPARVYKFADTVAVGSPIGVRYCPNGLNVEWPDLNIKLEPGSCCLIQSASTNLGIWCEFRGRSYRRTG